MTACAQSGLSDQAAGAPAERASAASEEHRAHEHLLITLELSPAKLTVLSARSVAEPLPERRGSRREPWRVDVEDAAGRVLFSAPVPAANVLRGELASERGAIHGVHLRSALASFAVRVPRRSGAARLRVHGRASMLASEDPRGRGRGPDQLHEIRAGE